MYGSTSWWFSILFLMLVRLSRRWRHFYGLLLMFMFKGTPSWMIRTTQHPKHSLYIIKIVVNYVLILKICSSFFGILGAIAGTTELLQSKILPFEPDDLLQVHTLHPVRAFNGSLCFCWQWLPSRRTVSIDKSSINSIALNESPHLKHMRMLVAGTVSVNASGTV